MARTAQRIESLIDDDPALAAALELVYDLTDAGEAEVEWADVRDELSSGHWGRLIETGLLVDGSEGFRIADVDAVEAALEDSPEATAPPKPSDGSSPSEEGQGWSVYDKAAAVVTLGLFAGYSLRQVRNLIGGTIDILLGPLDAALPFYVVVMVLALLTGLYSTLLQANLMDMEKMSEYQQRMKSIQERQKKAKEEGDEEKIEAIRQEQMEAMGDQLGMFKLQFRPMVWIMLLTIPVFLWMYWMILEDHIAGLEQQIVVPFVGDATWQQGIAGPIQLWIVWYFLCSMAFTQIIRKALNIQTTPT